MDPWEKRRLRLLYELHQRGDGVLDLAGASLGLDPKGPMFKYLKRELEKEEEINQVYVADEVPFDQELYRVTPQGRTKATRGGRRDI
jgi:hypothetical protein